MKRSEPIYAIRDREEILGIVWDTELGKIVTCEGKWNIKNDLIITDIQTGEDVDIIDLRNVLMSILPQTI